MFLCLRLSALTQKTSFNEVVFTNFSVCVFSYFCVSVLEQICISLFRCLCFLSYLYLRVSFFVFLYFRVSVNNVFTLNRISLFQCLCFFIYLHFNINTNNIFILNRISLFVFLHISLSVSICISTFKKSRFAVLVIHEINKYFISTEIYFEFLYSISSCSV